MGAFRSLVGVIASSPKGIRFADALTKSICVTNWDTNGDGELSIEEAGLITTIGTLFKGKAITSFNEFRFFDNVKSIDKYAFQNCTSLVSASLPNGISSIGLYGFYGCSKLVTLKLQDNITSIGGYAFQGCSNLALTSLPNGITSIAANAFRNCSKLALTSLPNGLKSINDETFHYCSKLALTSLPNGLKTVGSNSFSTTGISINELPESMSYIGNYAFFACNNIKSLILPTNPPTLVNANAFPASTLFKCKTQESLDAYRSASVWGSISESRFSLV